MKIKFVEIKPDERFIHNKKVVSVGEVIDVPKERADELIARGKVMRVTETPKEKEDKRG